MADPLFFSGDMVLHPVEDVAGNARLGHAGCSGPAQVVGGEVCDPQPVFNGTLGGMGKVGLDAARHGPNFVWFRGERISCGVVAGGPTGTAGASSITSA